MLQESTQPEFVPLEEHLTGPMSVLIISDTAADAGEISKVLRAAYAELFEFIAKHQLKPLKVMAFYHSYHPPFILDAGIQVDRIPFKLTGRIKARHVEGGHSLIAHYKGPYESVDKAYLAIDQWLKEHHKDPKGQPFEVYLNDPMQAKDSSGLLTDVYQPVK